MKTVRRPPYPKWNPGYFPCSSLISLPLSSRRPSVSFGGFGLSYLNSSGAWRGLQSVAKVTGERRIGEQVSIESRYYISSLPGDAKELLWAVREHWGIENSLHWVLDIAFREDESRVRKGHGPENLATIRHMALNLLRRETSST